MGSGAARELTDNLKDLQPLKPAHLEKLGQALKHLDGLDASFKTGRDEERYAQMVKAWGGTCKEIELHLRRLCKVFIDAHQISLDLGLQGGGNTMAAYVEETGGVIEKLWIRMNTESGRAEAFAGEKLFAHGSMEQAANYDWLEAVMVEWVVRGVRKKSQENG